MTARAVLYYRDKDRMASQGWRYYVPIGAFHFVMRRDVVQDESEFALCTEDQDMVAVLAVGVSCSAVCRQAGFVDTTGLPPPGSRGTALEARVADLEKTVKSMKTTISWLRSRHAVYRG